MKIVHSWLNDLVSVGDDVDAIADAITHLGLAVEDVARVARTYLHPDKLVIVEAGSSPKAPSTRPAAP